MSTVKRTFKIGGDMEVNRLGFGAMRLTGDGIWGDPARRKPMQTCSTSRGGTRS